MDNAAIFLVIVILCSLTVCIITSVLDCRQKTCKPPKEKMETVLTKLFHDYFDLNKDAFNAYKALIQAASNPSQTHRQIKR